MQKEWIIRPELDQEIVEKLAKEINVSIPIAKLLVQRNIKTFDEAKIFFRPGLENLYDPFLMKDMQAAVNRISKAISDNEKVMIYGDYDVDGTTSVALMYSFLKDKINDLVYYIPNRYKEGYGISELGINYANEINCSLIIALDCGIKAVDKIDYANSLDIDFIIVDHHEPGEKIPNAVAVLDPKQKDCSYPFKELSACGVGFKLIQAYTQQENINFESIIHFLDLVVVSIASDIVPIINENRILAYYGLKQLNSNPRKGLKSIMEIANIEESTLNISDLVFKIGPRINAAGRMDQGKFAVDILVSENDSKLPDMATQIDADNNNRKLFDSSITKEANEIIQNNTELINKKSTVLYNPDWHKGVIGIVASRLIDQFYKPTIILAKSNGLITGSARSVKGFNIYKALSKCEHLLEKFGGHMYAAGLTLKEENLEKFTAEFEKTVYDMIQPESEIPSIDVDAEIQFNDIKPKFFNILKQFEPFGPGNMSPIFISRQVFDTGYGKTVGAENEHLKLYLKDNSTQQSFSAIAFQQGQHFNSISKNNKFDICYSIEENTFKGKTNMQIRIRDIIVP